MKSRAVVSIALAAALGVSLSACNYFAPQRTTAQYSASDGVHATAGELELRNLMVIAPAAEQGEGATSAVLVGAVSNPSREATTLTASYEGGTAEIAIPAGETLVSLSFGEGETVTLTGGEFVPGQELDVTFTPSGKGSSVEVAVPILDGTLAEYSTLVPTAGATAPASTSTVAPTDGPVSTANEDAGDGAGTGTGTSTGGN